VSAVMKFGKSAPL